MTGITKFCPITVRHFWSQHQQKSNVNTPNFAQNTSFYNFNQKSLLLAYWIIQSIQKSPKRFIQKSSKKVPKSSSKIPIKSRIEYFLLGVDLLLPHSNTNKGATRLQKRPHNFWTKNLETGHSVRKEGGRGGHGKKKILCIFIGSANDLVNSAYISCFFKVENSFSYALY